LRSCRPLLTALIYAAYGDGGFNTSMRVTGGPDWINKTAFSVEGVASGPATPRQLRLMLRTLLEDRFALKIRSPAQTADIPMNDVLALVGERSDGTLGPKPAGAEQGAVERHRGRERAAPGRQLG
jgi:uncharacterized protein (TIGR03435 family)